MQFLGSSQHAQCILRVFICFYRSHCHSQCEKQMLNSCGNINFQSHLSQKCHDTNSVDVCCNMLKTYDSSQVWYFTISLSFVTHIVSQNVRDQSRWISLLCDLWLILQITYMYFISWCTTVYLRITVNDRSQVFHNRPKPNIWLSNIRPNTNTEANSTKIAIAWFFPTCQFNFS